MDLDIETHRFIRSFQRSDVSIRSGHLRTDVVDDDGVTQTRPVHRERAVLQQKVKRVKITASTNLVQGEILLRKSRAYVSV